MLHFPDLDPVAVAFAPAVDQAGALASYPAALKAEPIPEGTVEVPVEGTVEDSRIGRCRRCLHFRRPGLSDGYCTGRADLPHVYGFMRRLPDDLGQWCERFEDGEGAAPA